MVARVQYKASVALAAMQLRTSQDFHRVVPGFPAHAGPAKRAELVGDFAFAASTIMAAVNMEDVLHGAGQGP